MLPSDPEIDTLVAFVAVTDNVDVPPALIEAGLAEITTVGRLCVSLPEIPPHPAIKRRTDASVTYLNKAI